VTAELSAVLREAVVAFQMYEIGLLQAGRYVEWLDCFAEDVRYWMPVLHVADVLAEMESQDDELAYFDDSKTTLRKRVERLSSKFAWMEHPPSRLRYFVQPFEIAPREGDVLFVRSNVLLYQTRLHTEDTLFIGGREELLRETRDGLRVVSRKIVIDRNVLPSKNLSVFF
jgi:3-phenylpropionate/cinnamic acid dioxygenase small subunit